MQVVHLGRMQLRVGWSFKIEALSYFSPALTMVIIFTMEV